jgi:hypothetical protein
MPDVCSFCGNADFKTKGVDYVYRRGDKTRVVNGVRHGKAVPDPRLCGRSGPCTATVPAPGVFRLL